MPRTSIPIPDHLAFLNAPNAGGGSSFDLKVYGDRLEDDGCLSAAHILRYHEAVLNYRREFLALHRDICRQIQRIFGCRHTPRRRVSDEAEFFPHTRFPDYLYTRKSAFLCFRYRLPHRVEQPYLKLLNVLAAFERKIAPDRRNGLIVFGRPVLYAVATLPLLYDYLAGIAAFRLGGEIA